MPKKHLNNNEVWVISVVLFSVLVAMLFILLQNNKCPDVEAVTDNFSADYEHISIVLDFLVNSEYEDIYIDAANKKMLVGVVKTEIKNKAVNNAIKFLLDSRGYVNIAKNGNTIYFTQWTGMRDIKCGVAYSIDGINIPEIQFQTEVISLEEDHWYYFVCDYEKWRTIRKTVDGSLS